MNNDGPLRSSRSPNFLRSGSFRDCEVEGFDGEATAMTDKGGTMASSKPEIKLKLTLVGENAVGKTSLIRRFVHDDFQGSYVATLGMKLTKKELWATPPGSSDRVLVALMIWDIMGQRSVRSLLQDSFFSGAQGILMVCDVTRPPSLTELEGWKHAVQSVAGEVPAYLLANKADLRDATKLSAEDLESASRRWGCPYRLTSAKTGLGVEDAFQGITELILQKVLPKTH